MRAENKLLLIRSDAGPAIGFGHVMRCRALAAAWRHAGGTASFLTAERHPELEQMLRAEGCAVLPLRAKAGSPEDALETRENALQIRAAAMVVDGYQFDVAYQRQVSGHPWVLLVVDDANDHGQGQADLILNQNLHAQPEIYVDCGKGTRLLLGLGYALLRQEFLAYRQWQRTIPPVATRVLVTLGGGDPENLLARMIDALRQLAMPQLEAVVLTGFNHPYFESLQQTAGQCPFPIELLRSTSRMPELMAWADVALSAGGSTCWELAFMGLPNLIVVLAENQIKVAEALAQRQVATNLGWVQNLSSTQVSASLQAMMHDPQRRRQASEQGRQLVDGAGAERVIAAILDQIDARH